MWALFSFILGNLRRCACLDTFRANTIHRTLWSLRRGIFGSVDKVLREPSDGLLKSLQRESSVASLAVAALKTYSRPRMLS